MATDSAALTSVPAVGFPPVWLGSTEPAAIEELSVSNEVSCETLHDEEKLNAFLAAAEKHRTRLLWLAKRITNSREEAEDVVQHALMKAYVNLSRFRGDSQMSTWLGAIVQNTAREHMRSQRGRVILPLEFAPDQDGESAAHDVPDPAKNPEECFELQERQEIIRSAMQCMSDHHRLALQLCVLDDVPYLRAANAMDVTLSSMKSRVFRGKQLLRGAVTRRLGRTA
jgi:RNA polymerase sigma-70 factor, ECF subfamily